tara:strand:+ start:1088 stop:1729 length:642 start_codon:yes stop_codon:yes gene_type:complete
MLKKFKFKLYFRKSSFKKDLNSAKILFGEIENYKPKNFLEVGVFQGVTSRNVCEKLNIIYKNQFKYYGVDVFEDSNNILDDKEMTSKHNKISNPLKNLLFNFIFKQNLNSLSSVKRLLKKFNENVTLFKGLSSEVLPKINISEIDFVFLDGGHSYETVKNDLSLILKNIKKNKIIICDDYDQKDYGVKKAVDELRNSVTEIKELNKRLVKIIT